MKNNIVRYILTLVIALALVHVTKDILDYSRDIIILKDAQLKAEIKEKRKMHPSVKITSIVISVSKDTGFSLLVKLINLFTSSESSEALLMICGFTKIAG